MNDYRHMDLPALVDLLSDNTARYSKLLVEGSNEKEFASLKDSIRLLQAEIESRKKAERNKFADSDRAEHAG